MTSPRVGGAERPGSEVLPNVNLEPTIEHELRLAELFAVSTEVVEEQRPVLWEMVKTGLAGCVDLHDQRAMQLTGHVVDWQLFGGRGDPLPTGLVQLYGNIFGSRITYDPRQWFNESCKYDAQERLKELGLDSVVSAAKQDIESRRADIHVTVGAFIESSPEYRLVQSFNMQLPPDSRALPLSLFFRAVRERQVEEEVKLRHGVEGAISPGSAASTALRRHLQRLDDETIPRKTEAEPQEDALTRAREFFGQKVFDEHARFASHDREAFDRFDTQSSKISDESYLVIRYKEGYTDDDGDDYTGDLWDSMNNVAENLTNELSEAGTPFQRWIGEEFLQAFMERLLDPRTNVDYDAIVEGAIQKAAAYALEDYVGHMIETGMYSYPVTMRLRLPEGERMLDQRFLALGRGHESWHRMHSTRLGFSTGAELARQEQEVIGEVIRRPQRDNEFRLIQSRAGDDQIPRFNSGDELHIILTQDAFRHGADPHIPGYRLSSRNGDEYGFVRDSVDPYAQANVAITTEQRDTLAGQYAQLGLHGLADSIRRSPKLTVDSLVGLVREASNYPRPTKTRESYQESDDLPKYFEAHQLSDFASLVKEGILQVQCNGSAKFMQLSLEAIFGRGSAGMAIGNVLGSEREITASGHAQATFVHNDYVYLLDATPYSGVGRGWRPGFGRGTRFSPPHAATLENIPAVPDQPEVDLPVIDLAELKQMRLSSMQNALEIQLAVLFSAHDRQALYERVASLSVDDPVRRTLEVFIRAPRGETTAEELEALTTYLQQYRDAPHDLLAQMGVPAYETDTLESLIEPVRQIARYYR